MRGKVQSVPQEVKSFSDVPNEINYRVEFHRNTSGLCYYGIEVGASDLKEMKAKLNAAIDAVKDVIKQRGWREVGQ